MGRKKTANKNIVVSISITAQQKRYLDARTQINLSKLVQMYLDECMNLDYEIENELRRCKK